MNNDAYRPYFERTFPYFQNFTVTPNDIFEDEENHKAVVWARSTANSPVGPYANEYMLAFYFKVPSYKLTKFLEFVDSATSVAFFAKLNEYIQNHNGTSS
jgi:ketosteroid isomerase-like protein